MTKLSLSTYTYDDAGLLHGLLANERTWTVRPDEIHVTDDGSREPFAPRDPDARLRLTRLPRNRGFTVSKATGLDRCSGRAILSADCDMRLAPDWLALTLPHLDRPEVGLVAGRVDRYAGDDTVSRFLSVFDRCQALSRTGETDFVPGMVFLLRREVWRAVGGFGGHDRLFGEDHALCAALRRHGYRIFVEARAVGVQTRRLSRAAMCRRSVTWCRAALGAQLPHDRRLVPYLFEVAAAPMLERFAAAIDLGEPVFLYLDLLYLTLLVTTLLADAEARGAVEPARRKAFTARLLAMLAPYKRLTRLFSRDLAAMGRPLGPETADEAAIRAWDDFFLFADFLEKARFFGWMETTGLARLLAEDARAVCDHSRYAEIGSDP